MLPQYAVFTPGGALPTWQVAACAIARSGFELFRLCHSHMSWAPDLVNSLFELKHGLAMMWILVYQLHVNIVHSFINLWYYYETESSKPQPTYLITSSLPHDVNERDW